MQWNQSKREKCTAVYSVVMYDVNVVLRMFYVKQMAETLSSFVALCHITVCLTLMCTAEEVC
jgi:hypothetical protein